MNKREALKIAKEVDGQANLRHYGRGIWAVELAGGVVVSTVEAWEERKIEAVLQERANADAYAAYAYADEDDGQ